MAIEFLIPTVVFSVLFVLWVAIPARPDEVDLASKIRGEWLKPIIVVGVFVTLVFAGMLAFVIVLDWIIG